MWVATRRACTTCTTVVAADLGPYFNATVNHKPTGGTQLDYLAIYRTNLGTSHPTVWGYHPYSDVRAHTVPAQRTNLYTIGRWLADHGYSRASLWMNEVTAANPRQARYLLAELPRAGAPWIRGLPRIDRIYELNYAGLFRKPGPAAPNSPAQPPTPDGTTNNTYAVFLHRNRAH